MFQRCRKLGLMNSTMPPTAPSGKAIDCLLRLMATTRRATADMMPMQFWRCRIWHLANKRSATWVIARITQDITALSSVCVLPDIRACIGVVHDALHTAAWMHVAAGRAAAMPLKCEGDASIRMPCSLRAAPFFDVVLGPQLADSHVERRVLGWDGVASVWRADSNVLVQGDALPASQRLPRAARYLKTRIHCNRLAQGIFHRGGRRRSACSHSGWKSANACARVSKLQPSNSCGYEYPHSRFYSEVTGSHAVVPC
jgi:hypothetical protein